MEGMTGSVLLLCLLCLISLTNANTSPIILNVIESVCEDIPIGAVAFTINATDAENDPLTYSLSGPNAAYFKVDSKTGSVSVIRELDREGGGDVMTVGVAVSDGLNDVKKTLTILLADANDNRPIFQESSYDVEIPENTNVGKSLFRVQANDLDTGNAGVIHYSIDEVSPNEGFSLFSIVSITGEVRLSGRLNYTALNTFYRLKINATDGGGRCYYKENKFFSSVVFSFITVVDVPDLDPLFIGLPYVGRVAENSTLGMSVFKVTAIDQDTGVNDVVIYSIEDSTPGGLFKISRDDGIISVLSPIDREDIGDIVTLTVKATESKTNIQDIYASTTASVQINIIDINDNKPEFYKCGDELSCVKATHFTGEVSEHSLGTVSINMTVKDLDKISTTVLSLKGADKDVFSVEPQSTMSDSIVQLLVKQPQALDYELKQKMVLEVIAIDQEKPSFQSTATVTIKIKDINDNSPVFPKETYKLKVPEHSPAGTEVAVITAEDSDTMDQGNLTYRLLPDSILPYFDVEPHTGKIYVKNKTLVDREVRSLFSATLQARDTDEKPGTTVLEIILTDINDQPPVISRDSYREFVNEGGQLELKIEASDADDPGTENSQIVFGIVPSRYSDNFTIDPNTGMLRNKGELDREAIDPKLDGRIELNITATDKGIPPLSSMVTVIINVEDINDNSPQFKASFYNFTVKEGEKGAFVGSVYAEDLDQTSTHNRISFSIVNGSFGSFMIRTFAEGRGYRGKINVDQDIELNYESTHKQFRLLVEAADLEQKKAEVMVQVNVLDVNDERPEFKPTKPVTVKENTNINGAVGKFTGYDKDGNHSLVYEEESIKCRCNGSLTPCSNFILDPTGEVRLNLTNLVDYEQCDQVVIEAQVVDEYTEKGEKNSVTTGQMVINIEDINDNAPEFIVSNSVFVVVSESASKGTSVAAVTATDRDSGINRQIEFKVTTVQFEETNNHTSNMRTMFEAVTTQQKDIYVGIIQTTEGLDITLKGKYLVTVSATDTGGLSTSTVLEIFTVDESYKVELEFTSSQADVEKNLNEIRRALTAATKSAVEIVAIRSDTPQESRDPGKTIIVAYFVYSNGTALTSNEVEKMLSDPEHYPVLGQLGLANIGTAPAIEQDTDPVQYILLGMVGGLIIILAILTTSLLCTRRNYRRKLKAAKAMNSASMVTSDNQKSGPVVPGTNKYTMEGANPVLNLNIDTAMVLDLDEESSDVDKVSLNSLDYSDEMTERDSQPIMQMIREEEEEETGTPEYIEPLGAALAQRGQEKGSKNPRVGFSNPVFNTTDL
ncbi:cadherin-related family member 2 isoform X1 [Micropterus salmoides]|uniref:cadherin-related family member 2 isoform X1 n=1 Tax=Micropterus salmoides TaxID=27706 RepID=UPI0018ED294E|nr:cadherin-related family member 2 isoform X1 [Micropterus salmoides]